jgi:hypothetical protein
VSADVFAPGWTNYNKRIQYNVYDVTSLLNTGENVLSALLGDGWAAGRVGWGSRQQYVQQARFCAQPHAADAVTLRRWDDAAKDPHCAVPPLDSWRPLLASLLRVSPQP